MKVIPRLSEHGDVIEWQKQTPMTGPQKFFVQGPQITKTTTVNSYGVFPPFKVPTCQRQAYLEQIKVETSHE